MLLFEEDCSGCSSCLRAKQTLESTKAYRDRLPANDDFMVRMPIKQS